jgi:PKD repeat protein
MWAHRSVKFIVGVVLALVATAPAAAAAPVRAGKPGGIVRHHKGTTFFGNFTQFPQGSLEYYGGPVLRTNQTYAIFWDPAGKLSQPYRDLVVRYLQDVAADSGSTANVYSVLNQYSDTTGPIAYASTFAGTAVDTDPYPSGCPATAQYPACFTDAQLASELDDFLFAHGIARPANRAFMVFTPAGVNNCFDPEGFVCRSTFFCAYHGGFTGGHGDALYAIVPYAATPGCDTGQHPNGNDADPALDALSHEHREMIDDPLVARATGLAFPLAWFDPFGGESSDKCVRYYGAMKRTATGAYNQVVGGHPYLIQTDWSNTLAAPQGLGCVGDGVDRAPTARIKATVQGGSVSFDGTTSSDADPGDSVTSYYWDFGDFLADLTATPHHKYASAGTYHVSLLASDAHGATALAEQDVVVSNPIPAPTHSFKLDLTETIDSRHSEGVGNGTGLGKVISAGFARFDFTNFPVSVDYDESDLKVGSQPPGSKDFPTNFIRVSDHVTLTDVASPPAGNDYSLRGSYTIQGGEGTFLNATGSGTMTGSCTSSFDTDVVVCTEHWKGVIGGN